MAPRDPASKDPNEHFGEHSMANIPKKHVECFDARWRTKRRVRTCSVAEEMVDNNRPTDVPVELIADATRDAMHQMLRMNCHVTCLDLRSWICNLHRQTLQTRRDRDNCHKHNQKCARGCVTAR